MLVFLAVENRAPDTRGVRQGIGNRNMLFSSAVPRLRKV